MRGREERAAGASSRSQSLESVMSQPRTVALCKLAKLPPKPKPTRGCAFRARTGPVRIWHDSEEQQQ